MPKIVSRVKQFMDERGYENYRDFRDAVVSHISPTDALTIYKGNATIDKETCTGCGLCVNIGHCYAISFKNEKAEVVPEDCTGCSTCMDICPVGAVSMEQHEKMRNSNE